MSIKLDEILVCRAQQELTSSPTSENGALGTSDGVPTPIIKIDNQHDPFATVVTIEYGDRLGQLLDTVRSLYGSLEYVFPFLSLPQSGIAMHTTS